MQKNIKEREREREEKKKIKYEERKKKTKGDTAGEKVIKIKWKARTWEGISDEKMEEKQERK